MIPPGLAVLIALLISMHMNNNNNNNTRDYDVVVIGGGSAGLTAALKASEDSCSVLVLEKKTVGGNSAKASSGMSALSSGDATEEEIRDFIDDVVVSGGGLSDEGLVNVLVRASYDAVMFLQGLGVPFDASRLVQLGGHRVARTYTVEQGAVGWTIMSRLKEAIHGHVDVDTGVSVHELVVEGDGSVGGCWYRDSSGRNVRVRARKGVVLATGGFGHNATMVRMFVDPSVVPWSTTNGEFATGDGIVLGERAGAEVVGIDQIQIHPTAFVDPADTDADVKILAPEKLRGLGGILVSDAGRRFVDELSTRLEVSKAIGSLPKKTAHLILDETVARRVGPAMAFYRAKGLFYSCASLHDVGARIGVSEDVLRETIIEANAMAEGNHVQLGVANRTHRHVVALEGEYLVAEVTNAIHYTMGGLKIDTSARVLDKKNKHIRGLYAAGEVTGGIHGRNRLGGMSLLDCIVFGSIAGKSVSKTL